ncbi:MAG: septum site-determining protein MinC, partial [Gammaproteobacteria bacterium]|nr:septum site-determining protein MinC [Gammaproteobacteria bacterium]
MGATTSPTAAVDYEPAGELKIGQVGIANLRVRTLDVVQLTTEMRERVARAPKLFGRAAVIVDFGGLAQTPDAATARALLDGLREAGVLPVALAWGSSDNEQLAVQLGLPLLAKFRAQYEPVGAASAASSSPNRQDQEIAAEAAPTTTAPTSAPPPAGEPGLIQTAPVRSGQQVYADNRDLTVLTAVGAGAEVIADGSIHIYGALRGRALAGAQGNEKARIFCREFHAELVAVAGHYKVLE